MREWRYSSIILDSGTRCGRIYVCIHGRLNLFFICLDVEFPEKTKLRFMDKVPQMQGSIRPPKMIKNLKFMRGPEEVHNFLLHRQFGIIVSNIMFNSETW
jgi:hypothetical protein